MAGPDATMTIRVNERIKEFGGADVVLLDEHGLERPPEEQLTLGRVLLNLLGSGETPPEPADIIAMRVVGDDIARAMVAGVDYQTGTQTLECLRKAARYNGGPRPPMGRGPTYGGPLVLAQVWLAIGDGKPEPTREEAQ